jgi:acetylglutamate kinase
LAAKKKPTVIKIGGSTLGSLDSTLQDLVDLQKQGLVPVVVHGGGITIDEWMKRQGLMPRFIRGLRVTDNSSLQIVVAVLAGLVNTQLVAAITALGGKAIGLSGVDGGILEAQMMDKELGLVGDIAQVNPDPIQDLVNLGYMPILAPIAINQSHIDMETVSMLNVNGDTAAGHLAWALEAEQLIFLTDVKGVLDSSGRLIPRLTIREAKGLLISGAASGGMIPKLNACIHALERTEKSSIVDGRKVGALISAVNGDETGTQLNR